MLDGSRCVIRHISSVPRRMGRGLWRCCTPCSSAALHCLSPPQHHGSEATQDVQFHLTRRGMWWRRSQCHALCMVHEILGLQQGKVRQLWISYWLQDFGDLFSPPPLIQIWSCQASFIPGYLLYPWGILKICGLPPALWLSPFSHG